MPTKNCPCCKTDKDINDMIIIGTMPLSTWVCKDCAEEYEKEPVKCENCKE